MPAIPWWVKLLGAGAVVLALNFVGWKVADWYQASIKLAKVQAQLDAERKAHAQSEAARIKLSADLATEEGKTHETVREVIRIVPRLVRDDRACDLSDEVVTQLNHIRGYDK